MSVLSLMNIVTKIFLDQLCTMDSNGRERERERCEIIYKVFFVAVVVFVFESKSISYVFFPFCWKERIKNEGKAF